MAYVAMKTRWLNGTKYMAGEVVDVSDWEPELIERMKERRRIVWVPEAEHSPTPPPAPAEEEEAPVEVFHKTGGWYYRVDTGERVPPKGKRSVTKAGYKIVEAPAGVF